MEQKDQQLIQQFIDQDNELRILWKNHLDLKKRIEKLDKRIHRSTEEEMEKRRLQKLKLAGKDKIEKILLKYR